MTKIISAIVGKGGASKTTLLYSLAKYLYDEGNKVLVLDYDMNTSFTLQYERRRHSFEDGLINEMSFPEVRSMRAPKSMVAAQSQIIECGAAYDYVVVDLAGEVGLLHETVARISHLVLVPTFTEDKFVSMAIESIELIMDISQQNEGLPIAGIVRMSFPKNGIIARIQNKILNEYPLFDNITTPFSAQYEFSDKFGLSITEMDKLGTKTDREKAARAAIQMRLLCKEIYNTVAEL